MWWCRLQGSGTFSVEAAVATLVPRDGHVLVPDNGAYCKRAAKLTQLMGRRVTLLPLAEDAAVSPHGRGRSRARSRSQHHARGADPLRNRHRRAEPAAEIAAVCEQHGKGLIVDAMSSFAALPIDAREGALRRAGRRQRQVPRRRARHGLRLHPQGRARRLRRQQPEPGDGSARPACSTWKDGPVALHAAHACAGRAFAEALAQFVEEGGQPARLARYTRQLPRRLVGGHGSALGFKPFLKPEVQAPIIVTFHAPARSRVRLQEVLRWRPRRAASSSTRAS